MREAASYESVVPSTPICGIASAASEKDDKRLWHHRFRQRLHQDQEPLPLRAVSDPWLLAKDGKQWFDWTRHPRLMRK